MGIVDHNLIIFKYMQKDESAEIISKLKEFAARSDSRYSSALQKSRKDLSFAGGSQYTDDDKSIRGKDRAELVINTTRQYCNQVINTYKKDPYAAAISARKSEYSNKAEIVQGIIRGIEGRANLRRESSICVDRQVKCGRSYMVLTTDYENEEDGWEQEFKLQGIHKPEMVIWDPLSVSVDGSDATECAVVDHIPLQTAKSVYGLNLEYWENRNSPVIGTFWNAPDGSVACITYYVLERTKSKIYKGDNGETIKEEEFDGKKELRSREVSKSKVMIYKIIGDKVVYSTEAPISRLPVVPFLGEIIDTDDGIDYVGLVHFAEDSARLVNWTASLIAERISIAPKPTTYVDMRSIAPYNDFWGNSNKLNLPYLPFDSIDANGNQLPMPSDRNTSSDIQDVTVAMQTYQQAMSQILGIEPGGQQVEGPTNETAASILMRARNSERANYQYFENAAESIKAISKILLEWLNTIIDTPRTIPFENEDGELVAEEMDIQELGIIPTEYEVSVDSGPMLATQRKEDLQGMIAIGSMLGPQVALAISPETILSSDLPSADKISKKLELLVSKQLGIDSKGDATQPDEEALQALSAAEQAVSELEAQNQQMQAALNESNGYIMTLQTAMLNKDKENMVRLLVEEIKADNKLDLEALKLEGNLSEKQMDIIAKAEQGKKDRLVELAKLMANNAPNVDVSFTDNNPEYRQVEGIRGRNPANFEA